MEVPVFCWYAEAIPTHWHRTGFSTVTASFFTDVLACCRNGGGTVSKVDSYLHALQPVKSPCAHLTSIERIWHRAEGLFFSTAHFLSHSSRYQVTASCGQAGGQAADRGVLPPRYISNSPTAFSRRRFEPSFQMMTTSKSQLFALQNGFSWIKI